jgi:hypothetical protein
MARRPYPPALPGTPGTSRAGRRIALFLVRDF